MPVPTLVTIQRVTQAGATVDITQNVLFSTAQFDAQSGGGVGTFSFTMRDHYSESGDLVQAAAITTGDEIRLILDDVPYFGGYVMQKGLTHAFPVTATDSERNRYITVRGVSYNALFDRLITRNTADYLNAIPTRPGTMSAGALVTEFAQTYLDLPSGFNVTSFVDNVGDPQPGDDPFAWRGGGEQGVTWREQLKWVSLFNGAIFYIDAEKNLHYHAPESLFNSWGFSDRPNKQTVTSTTTFTGATYGFRELDTTEDITSIINDVFIWGGSKWAAADEAEESGVLFARRTNEGSVDTYGRWQGAETHFGELGIQSYVDARADAIVPPEGSDLPPGVDDVDGVVRNRSMPNWNVSLTWFGHDVPVYLGGTPAETKLHLIPGTISTIILYVHGNGNANPLIQTLPLRRVSISFPTLSGEADENPAYVRFKGDFGLSLDDPYQIWEAVLDQRAETSRIVSAGSSTVVGSPGGIWQGEPDESPNGTRQTFTFSSGGTPIVFAGSSSEVYVNGLRLRQGADYSENPSLGQITIFSPPSTGSTFWVIVRLAG